MNILLLQILVLLIIASVVGWFVGLWWQRRSHHQQEEVLHSKLLASDRQLRRIMNKSTAQGSSSDVSEEDQKAIDWLKSQVESLQEENTRSLATLETRDEELK